MRVENYTNEKLKKGVNTNKKNKLDDNDFRFFFLGLRVKGDNSPRADIDIGIEWRKKLPIKAKFKIKEEINGLPILYKFDIIDFKNVSEEFKKEAVKHIEYVN